MEKKNDHAEGASKMTWITPDVIDLEFGQTAGVKLNSMPMEYSRSGITYDPS